MTFLNCNRLSCLLAALAASACLNAQPTYGTTAVPFRVYSEPAGARFSVDGTVYTSAANFTWPAGSKHIVSFVQDSNFAGTVVSSGPALGAVQYTQNSDVVYSFNAWTDNTGTLGMGSSVTQMITADPTITWAKVTVTVNYRILLNFFDTPMSSQPSTCDPAAPPLTGLRVGLVLVGGQCFWNNAVIYAAANSKIPLNAFPYPGFVFLGWSSNLASNAFLTSYLVSGPVTLAPVFHVAKRVRFQTSPMGLQVLVDRSASPTLTGDSPSLTCPQNQGLPVNVLSGFPSLCRGDFDFAPGSTHVIGAISPQNDLNGGVWVFDSWGSGQGQNAPYTADNQTSASDVVIVKFVRGAQVSFVTTPGKLKLNVDGRSNWPAYNFVWGMGTSHQVSAPAQQTDAAGREYTFRGWNNGGSVAQSVTVDQEAVKNGLRMVASYDVQSRLVVHTSPAGQTVQIDGNPCQTPCNVDRPNGATVQLSAPSSIPVSGTIRMDLASWSDGGASAHTYTLNSDTQTITAVYNMMYQLSAGADPANGANYTVDPVSPDGFYPVNTQVSVAVEAKPGFKFRRWAGDLTGTYSAGWLSMTAAHTVVAMLDRVPYIAPTGVQNAAGVTPNPFVAPGSLIAVVGESLALDTIQGKTNPLAQTLDGLTITIADRILPLLSVSPQQVIAQLPSDLTEGDYQLTVHSNGQPDVASSFSVARNAPGLYSNNVKNVASIAAYHADGTAVTPDNPAVPAEQINILGTGFGPYLTPVIDGFYPFAPIPAMADPVEVLAADQVLKADWVGAAAGQTGMNSLLLTIPSTLPTATTIDFKVRINGVLSNTVVLPLQ